VRDYVHVVDIADAHLRALDYLNRAASAPLNPAEPVISAMLISDEVRQRIR
jgi:hypothetical protein